MELYTIIHLLRPSSSAEPFKFSVTFNTLFNVFFCMLLLLQFTMQLHLWAKTHRPTKPCFSHFGCEVAITHIVGLC